MKFVFTLQALLDLRAHAERQRQHAVAALEKTRLELEADLRARQNEIRSYKEDLRARLGGTPDGQPQPVDFRTVRLQARASLDAQARTQRLALQLAGVYRQLDDARALLRRAATERKAVELLKQRRYEEWQDQQKRVENAAMDEIGTMRAARAETHEN